MSLFSAEIYLIISLCLILQLAQLYNKMKSPLSVQQFLYEDILYTNRDIPFLCPISMTQIQYPLSALHVHANIHAPYRSLTPAQSECIMKEVSIYLLFTRVVDFITRAFPLIQKSQPDKRRTLCPNAN